MAEINPNSSDQAPLSLLQAKLRRMFALGVVPVDEEVEMRTYMANALMVEYERSRRQQDLRDAMDHNETILRRLPPSSPARPERLDSLSYALMSEHAMSNSWRALNEAVRYGKMAREEAVVAGLRETKLQSYFSILDNLGYALSHRNAVVESMADLDEAIECAREIKRCASRNESGNSTNIINLVSRLRTRYSKLSDLTDHEEAIQLITEQLSMSTPGTMQHGMALVHLGEMALEKFKRTDAMEDLNEALRQVKAGVETLPRSHEKRFQLESRIGELYSSRYKKSGDFADIRNAMLYSDSAVESAPPANQVRAPYLLKLMRYLRDFVSATMSIPDVDKAISIGKRRLEEIPRDDPQRHNCRWTFSDVLGRRYLLARTVESLIEPVNFIEALCRDYNELVQKSGSHAPVDSSLISAFKRNLMRLSSKPDSAARNAASTKLYELVSLACKSKDLVNALLEVQKEHGKQLQVYIDSTELEQVLSEEAIQQRVSEQEREEQAELEKRKSEPRWRPKEYETEFGVRQLAIDPNTKKFMFTIGEDLRKHLLGDDQAEGLTRDQFVEREARQERETFDKAKAEGKHPNAQLCRMCRYVKLLQPKVNEDGFTWKPCVEYIPFGNWNQVSCRHSCSICRLILSCITGNQLTNTLHPRLATIDWEVQGVGYGLTKLSGGETMLKLEYGMLPVGELRILTPSNFDQALRQGWEAKEQSLQFKEILKKKEGPVHATDGQQVDIVQLKQWLNNCDHNHGSVCNSYRGSGQRYAADIPMIVIDVVDDCLVEATSAVKYFTLSYVWGAAEMSKTLRMNYDARLQKGGLGRLFPATIADAITLVRSLGERFLWVDALCIVQDDEVRKQNDIKQMDIVYGKAFATIMAMHGVSAGAGLSGVNSTSRLPQQIQSVTISGRSKDLEFDPHQKDQETVHMVASPMPLHLALEVSTLDTRGWILQEQLLSRRCLYFTSHYVYFLCGREVLNECGISQPLGHNLDDWDQPEGTESVRSSPINNPLVNLQELADLEPERRQYRAFALYTKLVERYTLRKLSYESDILDGFSGLFAILNEYFQSDIISGLPTSALDLVLLWAPAARLPRRGCKLLTMGGGFDLGQVNRNFPSWSWAGWTGPIEYSLFVETISAEEPLPTPLISSYTIDVDGKLQVIPARISGKEASLISNSDTPNIGASSCPADVSLPHLSPKAPLISNLLQFFAPCVPLTAFTIPGRREYLSRQEHIHSTGSQSVRHILDPRGKRCGLWWEQAGYVYVGNGMSADAESKMLLVGINQHGDTFRPRKGPNRVEGEIRMFDEDEYPHKGKGSGLVNVLAIDLYMGHAYAERITVARIHVKAWEEAGPQMRLVQLV